MCQFSVQEVKGQGWGCSLQWANTHS